MSRAKRAANKAFGIFRRTPRGLEPTTAFDAELLDKYPIGSECEITFHSKKSDPQMRLYWVILGRILDSTEYPNTDHLSMMLQVETGYTDGATQLAGGWHLNPSGIRNMDGPTFSAYFDAAMLVIEQKVIPGLDVQSLIRENKWIMRD